MRIALALFAVLALSVPAMARGAAHAPHNPTAADRFSFPKEGSPDVLHTENVRGEATKVKRFDDAPSITLSEPPKYERNIE